MSFAETHRYGDVTAKRRHSPGTPLSSCAPPSSKPSPDPMTRSRSVLDTSTSFGADLTIGDPDLGTPVDQLGRQRSADAGRAAGNECNLPPTRSMPLRKDNRSPSQVTRDSGGWVAKMRLVGNLPTSGRV
jgi:hypothetical protein